MSLLQVTAELIPQQSQCEDKYGLSAKPAHFVGSWSSPHFSAVWSTSTCSQASLGKHSSRGGSGGLEEPALFDNCISIYWISSKVTALIDHNNSKVSLKLFYYNFQIKDQIKSYFMSWGSSVSIVTDYRLDDRGSIPDTGRGFFFLPLRPDRLWGPPSLLSNGYQGSFPWG
jgi:hypothetical protein